MFGKRKKWIPPPSLFNSSDCYLPVLLNLGEIQGWFLDVFEVAWNPFLETETVSLNYMVLLAWPVCVCNMCGSAHTCIHTDARALSSAQMPPSTHSLLLSPPPRLPSCFLRTWRELHRFLSSRAFYLQPQIRITSVNENLLWLQERIQRPPHNDNKETQDWVS